MFAIDGCKMPSNCAKEWSGTRADFEKKKEKLEKLIQLRVRELRRRMRMTTRTPGCGKEEEAVERLRVKVKKIEGWLKSGTDKKKAHRGM